MLGSKDPKHTQAPTLTKMAKPSGCRSANHPFWRQVISDLSVASTNVGDIAWDSMTIKTSHSLSKLSDFPQEITAVWLIVAGCANHLSRINRDIQRSSESTKGHQAATSFPVSSLFLPRESTLVAAGHVSARFLQIPEMWLKGGAGKLKFVSTRLPTEPSRECNL